MKIDVKVPTIGESINEVTIGQWLKEDGTKVETDEIICEVESEKATVEIVAEETGVLKIFAAEGDTAEVGSIIAEIQKDGEAKQSKKMEPSDTEVEKEKVPKTEKESSQKISPVAANILKKAGIPTDHISGTGSGGKVIKSDAIKIVESSHKSSDSKKETRPKKVEVPKSKSTQSEGNRSSRRERMSTLRKTISRRMLEAKQGTAMLTTINEIDMSGIVAVRKKYKEMFKERYDVNLGFMSFFTKAATLALNDFPVVNAMIDGDDIVYHDFCDISMAVSTPKGLVVPVIRDAEKLSLAQIEGIVAELAVKARDNKLTIEEMTGGTFSITNGGVFGSLISTPLINDPQSAILGMHTIQERPVARDGEVVIRPMMYISLSYDHRIIDGRESVSFLVRLKEILEDPIRMLLDI